MAVHAERPAGIFAPRCLPLGDCVNLYSAVLAVVGVGLVVVGAALFWPPLAFVLSGVCCVGAAYLLMDDGT